MTWHVTTLTTNGPINFTTGDSGVCERYGFEKMIAGVRDIFDSVAYYQVNCVKKKAISILSMDADPSLGRSLAKQVR